MVGLRLALANPGQGWLLARMLAWRLALPVLKRRVPLPRLVRLVRPRRPHAARPELVRAVAELAGCLYPLPPALDGHCLDRSLIVYRYLVLAGAEPELVVGLRTRDGETTGHVWATLSGRPFAEAPDSVAEYVPMLAFAADGSQRSVQ